MDKIDEIIEKAANRLTEIGLPRWCLKSITLEPIKNAAGGYGGNRGNYIVEIELDRHKESEILGKLMADIPVCDGNKRLHILSVLPRIDNHEPKYEIDVNNGEIKKRFGYGCQNGWIIKGRLDI